MMTDQLNRVIGDAVQLSKDQRLLKSVFLFRDSDFEQFEYKLWAASLKKSPSRDEVVLEDELVTAPALYIVYDGFLEMECEKYSKREKVIKMETFLGETLLFLDKNSKFGGKGGSKYHKERKYSGPKRLSSVLANEFPPQSLAKLKCHYLFSVSTFGQVWCVTWVAGKVAYA
ncbi:LOW QUALITY PROTEIN: hypothetical protein ACHAW6_012294 [Cyclotella cf. meneghiniana]